MVVPKPTLFVVTVSVLPPFCVSCAAILCCLRFQGRCDTPCCHGVLLLPWRLHDPPQLTAADQLVRCPLQMVANAMGVRLELSQLANDQIKSYWQEWVRKMQTAPPAAVHSTPSTH